MVELMRRVAPGLPVHGSTQMSITSAEGADFANSLGVDRVVVGRELSVREIAKVCVGGAALWLGWGVILSEHAAGGCVVLRRELSVREIAKVRQGCLLALS